MKFSTNRLCGWPFLLITPVEHRLYKLSERLLYQSSLTTYRGRNCGPVSVVITPSVWVRFGCGILTLTVDVADLSLHTSTQSQTWQFTTSQWHLRSTGTTREVLQPIYETQCHQSRLRQGGVSRAGAYLIFWSYRIFICGTNYSESKQTRKFCQKVTILCITFKKTMPGGWHNSCL